MNAFSRDHDRYVGTTNRQHKQHAQCGADGRQQQREQHAGGEDQADAETDRGQQSQPVQDRVSAEHHRPRGHQLLQFEEGDHGARETDRADHDREGRGDQVEDSRRACVKSVSSIIATMAAAPPPTPLNNATNCGI